MDKLQYLTENFKCNKRDGYGQDGCCNNKTPSTTKMKCLYYNRDVHWLDCKDCPYQENHGYK